MPYPDLLPPLRDRAAGPGGPDADFPELARFAFVRRLGVGGMGTVYEVFDRERGEPLALKTLLRADASDIYRLKSEFRALSGISHRNLVQLYELTSTRSLWFFTMELLVGADFITHAGLRRPVEPPIDLAGCSPTLSSPELRGDEPLPRGTRVARIEAALPQLAEALTALHTANKLHRDIKPSNILVTSQGRLVLLDFGLVAENDARSAPHGFAGTPAYMSPEQLAGRALTPASDLYSVGLVLYQALTGIVPHLAEAKQLLELRRLRQSAPAVRARATNPDVPEHLDELCARLLEAAPEKRPSSQEVAQLFRNTTAEVSSSSTHASEAGASKHARHASTGLIGRDAELIRLRQAYAASAVGSPAVVAVYGPSGIGKTALVQHFTQALATDGCLVLRGRCFEQESMPYKALDSLVDELCSFLQGLPRAEAEMLLPRDVDAIARLFPVVNRVDAVAARAHGVTPAGEPREERRRAVLAFRDLLVRVAAYRRLMLWIDDVQWGDVDSADLLGEIFRLPSPPPHLLLFSCRSEDREDSAFLRTILPRLEPVGVRAIELAPLAPEHARELAQAILPRRDRRLAQAMAGESAGSPFVIGELAGYASRLASLEGDASSATGRARLTLQAVVRSRMSELPAEARRLLELLAIGGRPLPETVVCRAARTSAGQAMVTLLRNAKLIRTTARSRDTIEVYHDRIREELMRGIAPEARSEYHRLLAEALEASGDADPELLAHHFHAAGATERATHYALAATERATQTLAFDRVARLCELSLTLLDTSDPRALTMRVKKADALADLGRGPESAREYLTASASADVAGAFALRQKAAERFLLSGHVDEGLRIIHVVLKELDLPAPTSRARTLSFLAETRLRLKVRGIRFEPKPESPALERVRMRIDTCWTLGRYRSVVDPVRGWSYQALGLLLALRIGDKLRICRGLCLEACYLSTGGAGELGKAQEHLRAARVLADELNQPYLDATLDLAGGVVAFMGAGGWARSSELCLRSVKGFRERCRGVSWELSIAQFFYLASLLVRGEVAELAAHLPAALKSAQDNGDSGSESFLRLRYLPFIWLAHESPPDVWTAFDKLAAQLAPGEFDLHHAWERYARAQRLLYAGEGAAAHDLVSRMWPSFAKSLVVRTQFLRIEIRHLKVRCLVAAAADTDELDPARAALLRSALSEANALEREGTDRSIAFASLVRAGVASLRGSVQEATGHLHEAADRFGDSGMGLFAAAARLAEGRFLRPERGQALAADAEAWMRDRGVANPERLANMLAPGFMGQLAAPRVMQSAPLRSAKRARAR